MNSIVLSFVLSSLAGLSTLIGALIIFVFKKKEYSFLIKGISFAAGVMLSLSIFFLIPESISFLNNSFKFVPSLLICFIFVCIGTLLCFFIDKIFPSNISDKNIYKLGLITMISLTIHNIPEGIVTFITSKNDINLGISLAFSIGMHNIPEGISVALPIYYYYKSKKKAFLYTSICALSEPFGALISYLFLKPSEISLGCIYGLIAGIMVYISIYELLPNSLKSRKYKDVILYFILGIILMIINSIVL